MKQIWPVRHREPRRVPSCRRHPGEDLVEPDDAAALTRAVNLAAADLDQASRDFEPVWEQARALTLTHMVDEVESVYVRAIAAHGK